MKLLAAIVLAIGIAALAQASCDDNSYGGVCVIGGGASQQDGAGGQWHTNIVTTEFGYVGDYQDLAAGITSYKANLQIGYYAALPTRSALRRNIEIRNPRTGVSKIVPVLDVGPWNVRDNNYVFNANVRPQAEGGRDAFGRRTNRAGLDVSRLTARYLGISGMGQLDWRFVS